MTYRLGTSLGAASAFALGLSAFSMAALHAVPAQACGGTFCDGGSAPTPTPPPTPGDPPMPVEQTGETIIFHVSEDEVEAHIRIDIDETTTANQFAWVIPVPAEPDFEIGSERFFRNVLGATQLNYGQTTTNQQCSGGSSTGGTTGGDDTGGDDTGSGGTGEPADPTVLLQETMGAFEITVLEGGTVDSVLFWLEDNGYWTSSDLAGPLLQEYIDEGMMFIALKLHPEAGQESVHPIVIRYPGNEPCIPLRLTSIAASDSMEIRAYFFGEHRVVPTTYEHVVLDHAGMDWSAAAAGYGAFVDAAIDEAGGRAFVTEYAGPASVVPTAGLWNPSWDASRFAGMQNRPEDVLPELAAQGLWDNFDDYPESGAHPLLASILGVYMPVPDFVDPLDFWECVECFAGLFEDEWDAQGFADTLDERIFQPGLRATEIIEDSPTLTGLYTRISPHEMTEDPMFVENPDLPNRTTLDWTASRTLFSDGTTTVDVPPAAGGDVWRIFASTGGWPNVGGLPFAERIERGTAAGPMQVVSDNRPAIDEAIDAANAGFAGSCENAGTDTGTGGETGDDGLDGGAVDDPTFQGCGCSAGTSPGGGAGALGLFALAALRRRRRS